jgi:hypothetical protein
MEIMYASTGVSLVKEQASRQRTVQVDEVERRRPHGELLSGLPGKCRRRAREERPPLMLWCGFLVSGQG